MFDPAPTETPTDRQQRARNWIHELAELPERSAGTHSERVAADRIATWMRGLGITEIETSDVQAGPRAGFVLAIHTGLAALGVAWGGLLGSLLALGAFWSFRRELRHRRLILSRLFPSAKSINVIGRYGPERPSRRLILSAHIDAAQAGFLFSQRLADIFARGSRGQRRSNQQPSGPHTMTEIMLIGGAVVALAAWFGAHGTLFSLARGLFITSLGVGCALGLEWAFSRTSPGANDNASAVAAMLTSAEKVVPQLPADVELWVVGTGAEEVGCVGMHHFVTQHPGWPPERTYFVNFECVGGGALHYIGSEGVLGRVTYPPDLLDVARRVVAGGGFGDITCTHLLAGTDGHVPAELGYPTLSLISLEPNGVPRNYHRPNDTVDGIDTACVVRAADFGTAVAFAALNGAAGPIKAAS